eukprot:9488077-Pyramimonas_sp.AAC.1
MYANHIGLFALYHTFKCDGSHTHATVCNKELAAAAHYTRTLQRAIVETVATARRRHRQGVHTGNGFHTYVVNCKGYDLDDPTIPRTSDGAIIRPPEAGLGCEACADKRNSDDPWHARNPKTCRWHDKDPHSFIPKKCRFAIPKLLPYPQPAPAPAPAPAEPPQPRAPGSAPGSSSDHLRQAGGRGDARTGSTVVGSDGQQRVVGGRGRMETPAPPPPPPSQPATAQRTPELPDWSRFDVQLSLQALRSPDPYTVRKKSFVSYI